MTRLKPSLRNLAKAALKSVIIVCLLNGCTPSITPTYTKEEIPQAIQDICKTEYKLDIKARLVGETLWIYLPTEDLFSKSEKPQKYIERFAIEKNEIQLNNGYLKLDYLIRAVPEKTVSQEFNYSKDTIEKMRNVLTVLRRVLYSAEHLKSGEPKFICSVTADIKNGFQIRELIYYLDLKKVSYGFISWEEYQHRTIQDLDIDPEIISDREGKHLDYKDFSFDYFITTQIKQRVKLKFQKPEVGKYTDIDKEILKTIIDTVKIYGYKNFSQVELNNIATNNKIILNSAAIWARSMEKKF